MSDIPQFQRIDIGDLNIADANTQAALESMLNILNPYMEDVYAFILRFNQVDGTNSLAAMLDTEILSADKGDLLVHDGLFWVDFPVGIDGAILTADSGKPQGVSWTIPDTGVIPYLYVCTIPDTSGSPLDPPSQDLQLEGLNRDSVPVFEQGAGEFDPNITPLSFIMRDETNPSPVYGAFSDVVIKYNPLGGVLWSFNAPSTGVTELIVDGSFVYIISDWLVPTEFTLRRFDRNNGAEVPFGTALDSVTDITNMEVINGNEFFFSDFSSPNLILRKFDIDGVLQWTETNTLGDSQQLRADGDGNLYSLVEGSSSPFRKIDIATGLSDYSINLTASQFQGVDLLLDETHVYTVSDRRSGPSEGFIMKIRQSDGVVDPEFGWAYDIEQGGLIRGAAIAFDSDFYFSLIPVGDVGTEIENITPRGILKDFRHYFVNEVTSLVIAPRIGQFRSTWLANVPVTPTPTPVVSPSRTPTPTPTPDLQPTPTPTAAVSPTPAISPTPTTTPTPTQTGPTAFVSIWDTTSGGTQPSNATVTLPLGIGGSYNFNVDWGDLSSDDIVGRLDPNKVHTYAVPGTYTITITGTLQGWSFQAAFGGVTQFNEITQWGIVQFLPDAFRTFWSCANLTITATDAPDVSNLTSMNDMFGFCTSITQIPNMGTLWDVSNVLDLTKTFSNCTLFDENIGAWSTGNVTQMFETFQACNNFNGNLINWDTSSCINMTRMFAACNLFNHDLNWDVSNVFFFTGMFSNATIFDGGITNWVVESAINMAGMFDGADAFNQPLDWNPLNVTTFDSMFDGGGSFDQDIGNWDISSLTTATAMFFGGSLSTASYDALLIGWESGSVNNSVNFSAGGTKFSVAAAAARLSLTAVHFWIIQDGGPV